MPPARRDNGEHLRATASQPALSLRCALSLSKGAVLSLSKGAVLSLSKVRRA